MSTKTNCWKYTNSAVQQEVKLLRILCEPRPSQNIIMMYGPNDDSVLNSEPVSCLAMKASRQSVSLYLLVWLCYVAPRCDWSSRTEYVVAAELGRHCKLNIAQFYCVNEVNFCCAAVVSDSSTRWCYTWYWLAIKDWVVAWCLPDNVLVSSNQIWFVRFSKCRP